MKKALAIIAVIVLLCAAVMAVPLVNNACAAANYDRLTELPVPADTVCVETVSYTGRLVGNGNGMQFFAAMLVESKQTLQELEAYYTPLGCTVQEQAGQTIDRIDSNTLNAELSFETIFDKDKTYYLVYSWGDGIPPFSWLDIRGA